MAWKEKVAVDQPAETASALVRRWAPKKWRWLLLSSSFFASPEGLLLVADFDPIATVVGKMRVMLSRTAVARSSVSWRKRRISPNELARATLSYVMGQEL